MIMYVIITMAIIAMYYLFVFSRFRKKEKGSSNTESPEETGVIGATTFRMRQYGTSADNKPLFENSENNHDKFTGESEENEETGEDADKFVELEVEISDDVAYGLTYEEFERELSVNESKELDVNELLKKMQDTREEVKNRLDNVDKTED